METEKIKVNESAMVVLDCIFPVLPRKRQKDHEFKASLYYYNKFEVSLNYIRCCLTCLKNF